MAYATSIAKASKKYRWPSWVVYDQNFRQEAVSSPAQPWSKIDPSIYSLEWQRVQKGGARHAKVWTMPLLTVQQRGLTLHANDPGRQQRGNTEKHPARSARSSTTTTVIAHSARDAAMLTCATDARVATP